MFTKFRDPGWDGDCVAVSYIRRRIQSHFSHIPVTNCIFGHRYYAVIDKEGVIFFVETLVIPSREHVEWMETLGWEI